MFDWVYFSFMWIVLSKSEQIDSPGLQTVRLTVVFDSLLAFGRSSLVILGVIDSGVFVSIELLPLIDDSGFISTIL